MSYRGSDRATLRAQRAKIMVSMIPMGFGNVRSTVR